MKIPDYTNIYDTDRLCLMCRHVCPVERITKREATSPHGWTLLVASVQRGLLLWDDDTIDTLYQCADCGCCEADHPTDRPIPAAIVAARARAVEQGAMPGSVRLLDESLRRWGNPYGEVVSQDVKEGGEDDTSLSEVGLFVGASTYFERPQSVQAMLSLLGKAGVSGRALSAGRSGVYLPYTVGLWETARELAKQSVKEIEIAGVSAIVTLSREDAHAFAHVYPEIGVELPERVRVVDLADWLWEQVEAGRLALHGVDLPGAVYHDPCHTARLLESAASSRKLLKAALGYKPAEMFWRHKDASPCGAIGGFPFTQPVLAEQLARARIKQAHDAGAQALITEDPVCAAHLAKYAGDLPVISLVEAIVGLL